MALTNSFPTGLPAGLSIVDTRRIIGSLIVCDTTGNPRLGVLPRNTSPIVTSTATLNYAVVAADFVTSRTGVGAELLSNDGTTNVLTTAAPASNARTDVIWVRPQFTASADATNTPVFGVTQGVTSGTVPPPEPSIPAGALKLATAYFPAGATATNSAGVVITQVAQFTAASGGVVMFRTFDDLKAWTTAQDGQLAKVAGVRGVWERSGSLWVPQFSAIGRYSFGGNINNSTGTALGTPAAVTSGSSVYQSELWTPVASGLQVTRPGIYRIGGKVSLLNQSAVAQGFRVFIEPSVAGVNVNSRMSVGANAAEDSTLAVSAPFAALAGQSVTFQFFQASGGTLTFIWDAVMEYVGPLA